MKKIILLSLAFIMAVFVLCAITPAHAQKVELSANGIFYTNKYFKDSATKIQATNKLYVDSKGIKYPVYTGSKGGMFYYKISKSGTTYKCYIKA